MRKTNNIINQHIRLQFVQNLNFIVPVAIIFICFVTYSLYNQFSPITSREIVIGLVQSVHQGQSQFNYFYVRLENDSLIRVSIRRDRNIPFRKNEKVELEKIGKSEGPIIYFFKRYAK